MKEKAEDDGEREEEEQETRGEEEEEQGGGGSAVVEFLRRGREARWQLLNDEAFSGRREKKIVYKPAFENRLGGGNISHFNCVDSST